MGSYFGALVLLFGIMIYSNVVNYLNSFTNFILLDYFLRKQICIGLGKLFPDIAFFLLE